MEIKRKLIPPVIKWTGSKRSIAPKLAQLFPVTNRFFDPFVGGGALLPFFQGKQSFVGDIIPELISLWILIKDKPEFVSSEYFKRWKRLQLEGYQVYYEIRANFNKTKDPLDFLFLSRTCVNGLIRYNKEGEFNNSLHHTRPGIRPEKLREVVKNWSDWIRNTSFANQDYRLTLSRAKKGDTVFLDPPYVGTGTRYIPQTFDYNAFFTELKRLNRLEVNWILTLDGEAGDRAYDSKIPKDIYKESFKLATGKSPFSKVINNKDDTVLESIYLNFEPPIKVSGSIFEKGT